MTLATRSNVYANWMLDLQRGSSSVGVREYYQRSLDKKLRVVLGHQLKPKFLLAEEFEQRMAYVLYSFLGGDAGVVRLVMEYMEAGVHDKDTVCDVRVLNGHL